MYLNFKGTLYHRILPKGSGIDCDLCAAENDQEMCLYFNKYCKPVGHFVACEIDNNLDVSGRFNCFIKIPLITH